jgi:hypothetical protein
MWIFLERVQDIEPLSDLHRVDQPVRVGLEPQGNLKHATADAFERLGCVRTCPNRE